jgi:hypothetical protein
MTRRRRRRPASPTTNEPRLRLSEPVDVLAAVPYLVGYHPTESLVLLGLRGRQLIFTARYDLPALDSPRRVLRATVEHLLDVVARQSLTGVLIVAFGSEERARPLAMAARDACARTGLDVLDVLRVSDGRYWSYLCTDPQCCPPEGSPYDAGTTAMAAEWTVAGRVALPDRDTYEEQLKPVMGVARVSVRQATARAGERLLTLLAQAPDEAGAQAAILDRGRAAIEAALSTLDGGRRLSDDDVAWISVLMASSEMRSIALAQIKMAGDDLTGHRDLWLDVLRRAERDLTAAPACLFAFAAWRAGDGALARLALEQALRVDPTDDLADAMHHMLSHGVPPTAFDEPRPTKVKRRSARRLRKRSSSRRAGSR